MNKAKGGQGGGWDVGMGGAWEVVGGKLRNCT